MSRVSTTYDNFCLFCNTQNTSFYYQEYCNNNCEHNHKYKLQRKAKNKEKREILFNRIEQLEERISVLENIINHSRESPPV